MVTASKEFTNGWALHNAACANVNDASVKLSGAFREVSNRRATHETVCAEVKKASQRTADLKRKATEAHERCRRITNEHTRSEAAVNHSLGSLGWCVKETAAATHSLTCGVPDRESNEIHYLKHATELIEEWQRLLQGVQPMNAQTSENEEVVLVERQR